MSNDFDDFNKTTDRAAAPGGAAANGGEAGADFTESADSEAAILRDELERMGDEMQKLSAGLQEAEERNLRVRAELDTMRRRMQGEVHLARDAGIDSALAPVLSAFDDLERALAAAESSDPSSIVPGVRTVQENLLRNLAALDVQLVGRPGDEFDHDVHEALTLVPLTRGAKPGTIAQVYEAGFVKGDRLVRPARVTVYAPEAD